MRLGYDVTIAIPSLAQAWPRQGEPLLSEASVKYRPPPNRCTVRRFDDGAAGDDISERPLA